MGGRTRGVAAAAVVAAFAVVAGAACGSPTSSAGSANGSTSCDLPVGDVDVDELDGALVIMLDGTVSSEGQADRVADLVELLDGATIDSRLAVTLGSFGGSGAEVRFSRCIDGTPFVPQGNNDRTRERNRPALLDATISEIARLDGGYETSDPTAALRAGVERLESREGARVLVIHTDGIPTAGCAALPAEVNVSEPGLVERIVARCVEAGELPAADGVDVVVGGIGRISQDLSAESVGFLIDLNAALCEATGATCRVDPNLPPGI